MTRLEVLVDGRPLEPGDYFTSLFPSDERDRSYTKSDLFLMRVVRVNRKTVTVYERNFGYVRLTPERIVNPSRPGPGEDLD